MKINLILSEEAQRYVKAATKTSAPQQQYDLQTLNIEF